MRVAQWVVLAMLFLLTSAHPEESPAPENDHLVLCISDETGEKFKAIAEAELEATKAQYLKDFERLEAKDRRDRESTKKRGSGSFLILPPKRPGFRIVEKGLSHEITERRAADLNDRYLIVVAHDERSPGEMEVFAVRDVCLEAFRNITKAMDQLCSGRPTCNTDVYIRTHTVLKIQRFQLPLRSERIEEILDRILAKAKEHQACQSAEKEKGENKIVKLKLKAKDSIDTGLFRLVQKELAACDKEFAASKTLP